MENEDKVTIQHPGYVVAAPYRQVFREVCEGTAAVRLAEERYLPRFPKESPESYKFRLNTATLLNVTEKTRDTMCGLVFQKELTLGENTPQPVLDLKENIDNKGNHLNVFARDLFEDSFEGCAGILVDAPTAKAADLEQQKKLGLRPYWIKYKAADIINWDYQINPVSKRRELSLVVLREVVTEKVGLFARKPKTRFRVLTLEGGAAKWQLWTAVADKKDEYQKTAEGVFERQTAIPFAVVGELADLPPLMDLAYKNIEHYQTYSDYKSIIHKTCVPLFYSIGLDGEPTAIGGDIWFKCGIGGEIGFAEVSGTSIDKTEGCLENIKKEMAMLGLAMLAGRPDGDVTATESLLDSIQETSSLQVRATQLKDALELAFGFTAQYMGMPEDNGTSVELGATWATLVLSAQDMKALSDLVELGQFSLESFLWYLEKAGKLPPDIDAQKEMKRIEQEQEDKAGTLPVLDALGMPNEKKVQVA